MAPLRRRPSVLRVGLGLLVIALVVAFDPDARGPALVALAVLGTATLVYLGVSQGDDRGPHRGPGRGRGPGGGPRPRG